GAQHLIEECDLLPIARSEAQRVPATDRVVERGRDRHPILARPIPRVATEERRHPRPDDPRIEVVPGNRYTAHAEHITLAIPRRTRTETHDGEVRRAATEIADEADDLLSEAHFERA